MGKNQSELEIVVSAKDEASAALQDIGKKAESTGSSFMSLSSAVAIGQAAFEALESAGKAVLGFLEDSVSEAARASGQMAIVRQNILNAGLSFDEIGPKIQAYSERMQLMGFDNEETSQSLSKLILITGNYQDALKLNHLAMDLARSKGIDLATATTSIAQVMQGAGARALYQYGLNIKDAASTTEILTELQDKVKGSTEAYANSAQGQLDQVRLGWEDIKKAIGNDLMPVVLEFFQIVKDGMPVIRGLLDGLRDTLERQASMIHSVGVYIKEISGDYDHYVKATDDATKSTEAVTTSFEGIGKATATALTHAKAIENMGDDYRKMKDSARISLAELSDTFQSDMSSIAMSMKKVEEEQFNLKKGFNRQASEDASSLADKIIDSEQKIKDIKVRIANEADSMKRSQLQGELYAEQQNYDSSAEFRQSNAQAITEAQRRRGLTGLQREIEDYNSRRKIALEEFTQRMSDLDDIYKEEQKKKNETVLLYNLRNTEINKLLKDANTEFKKMSDERANITKEEVDQEIKYFQALASAVSAAKSGSKSSVSLVGTPVAPRASGGPVSPYMPYIVGEQGPELFVPSSQGTILPNSRMGGGTNINISIGSLTGTDRQSALRFADQIARILEQQLKLRTI